MCRHMYCPLYRQPSHYVNWAYLKRNELARDHGKRMFYTDATGETVPASDEEDEASRKTRVLYCRWRSTVCMYLPNA